jgi:hypothetical protein
MRVKGLAGLQGAVLGVVACVGLASVLVVPALASKRSPAPARYVSGRFNAPGYTLAVVGYNGKAVFSRSGSFRLRAPDSKVTLQLINSHGVYAGPVVFGGSFSRVITGIRAGANVGAIVVVAAQGYGHTAHKLAARSLDKTRWAYAKHGVPIGNGLNLGLVVSQGKGGGKGAGADTAHVGIPNEFDVAVPGTKVLRALAPALKTRPAAKPKTPAKAKLAAVCPPPPAVLPPGCTPPPGSGSGGATGATGVTGAAAVLSPVSPWASQLFLSIDQTLNIDAAGVTQAEVDATLQARLDLLLTSVPAGNLVELNCNGLSFCSPGGSGQAQMEGLPQTGPPQLSAFGYYQIDPFPSASLDPATGFGELVGPAAPTGLLGTDPNGSHEFNLDPNATAANIGSGDVATEVVTTNGVTTQIPITLGFVFNTVPALASYSDSAGDSAIITYPDTSGLGTNNNPIKLAAGANGDVAVTFTVFRPQRTGVPGAGEPAYMDLGHLGYTIGYGNGGPAGGAGLHLVNTLGGSCSTASYSNLSPTLSLAGAGQGGFGPVQGTSWLIDAANDQPAAPANTISFTVDLTKCLADGGNPAFPIGQPIGLGLDAESQSSSDHAQQTLYVERTS